LISRQKVIANSNLFESRLDIDPLSSIQEEDEEHPESLQPSNPNPNAYELSPHNPMADDLPDDSSDSISLHPSLDSNPDESIGANEKSFSLQNDDELYNMAHELLAEKPIMASLKRRFVTTGENTIKLSDSNRHLIMKSSLRENSEDVNLISLKKEFGDQFLSEKKTGSETFNDIKMFFFYLYYQLYNFE
jgi:hypothetical protein